MQMNKDLHRLEVYLEARKRKIFVGLLTFREVENVYRFTYDAKYLNLPDAIPLGPDLSLFKKVHTSKVDELFPTFVDRIPSRRNPAYEDYCHSQGIDVQEKNPIVLLGAIGQRGPSSFVFSAVFTSDFAPEDIARFRKLTAVSLRDLATAFDIRSVTLQRIENGQSRDANTIKLMQIYLEFPEVALWELEKTKAKISSEGYKALVTYFASKTEKSVLKRKA